MTDIRRTILWVVFTMSLVLLWDGWQRHNGHPSMFGPAPAKTASAPGTPASAVPGATLPASGASAPAAVAAADAASAPAPVKSELVTVTTDVVKATLDTRGGALVRVELLKHADDKDPSGHVVVLDPLRSYSAQTALRNVPGAPTHQTVLTLVDGPRELKDGADTLTVRLESPPMGGVKLAKVYTFKRGDYAIDVKHEVTNVGTAPLVPELSVWLVRDDHVDHTGPSMAPSSFTGPTVYTDQGKMQKVPFDKLKDNKADYERRADDGWIAMVQHYFVSAWLRNEPGARAFDVSESPSKLVTLSMVTAFPTIAPGATGKLENLLYVGPQEEKRLEQLAPGLERVKDYGMFTILAKPLFWLMDLLHKILGNWGWAIVGVVVLLKIAFYGLNAKAYRSMAKMKAINPRIQELRERYKDKPQQQQQEMMRLYREEKINPLGSCLPILLQMPVFLALYWVLLSSVEMRGAPWVLWVHDLSRPDAFFTELWPTWLGWMHVPLGPLPLLMTATSLLQVWLNPQPTDPVQAKMMWIMPLAFSVMFFFFPAGLTLYYFVNNLLSIAQQWMINKQHGVTN
ncbi:membrane protein insertase YidC [Roseateles sp. SL47]|jgi:YidC/Oxa1 family membrane protein insertase|uniref:membrane protein insertase YidC n=1 Tax=Roseateles sp. SL47 TaxID=2995138 RepID=UPI002270B690|nr:membrane protein insertase YidC [Roseateles sp. SL47]WAC74157.1 membrane protein insertase YidC [Roseateles sp. SL47]